MKILTFLFIYFFLFSRPAFSQKKMKALADLPSILTTKTFKEHRGRIWWHRLDSGGTPSATRINDFSIVMTEGNSYLRHFKKGFCRYKLYILGGKLTVTNIKTEKTFFFPPGQEICFPRNSSKKFTFKFISKKTWLYFVKSYFPIIALTDLRERDLDELFRRNLFLTYLYRLKAENNAKKEKNLQEEYRTLLQVSDIFIFTNQLDEAKDILKRAIKQKPKSPPIIWRMVVLHLKERDYKSADIYLNKFLQQKIEEKDVLKLAYYYKSLIALKQKKWHKANTYIDKTRDIDAKIGLEKNLDYRAQLLNIGRENDFSLGFDLGHAQNITLDSKTLPALHKGEKEGLYSDSKVSLSLNNGAYLEDKSDRWGLELDGLSRTYQNKDLEPMEYMWFSTRLTWRQRSMEQFFLKGLNLSLMSASINKESEFFLGSLKAITENFETAIGVKVDQRKRVSSNQSSLNLSQKYLLGKTKILGFNFSHKLLAEESIAFVTSDIHGNEYTLGYNLSLKKGASDRALFHETISTFTYYQWEKPYNDQRVLFSQGYKREFLDFLETTARWDVEWIRLSQNGEVMRHYFVSFGIAAIL